MGKYKLNKKDKDDLRKELDEYLSTLKFDPDKRIKLPLPTLELIMFDKDKNNVTVDGKEVRKIGFISDNLCKLDLSKLSFKNVNFFTKEYKNFSNTNINIDFSELYYDGEIEEGMYIQIWNTSFKNVDLSNNDISNYMEEKEIANVVFHTCDLTNTGLKIYNNEKGLSTTIIFRNCNLTGVDLSDIAITLPPNFDDVDADDLLIHFEGKTNFHNTQITFINEHLKGLYLGRFLKEIIKTQSGFYIEQDGKMGYIKTPEEKNKERINKKRSYTNFFNKRKHLITCIVTRQINLKNKKDGVKSIPDSYFDGLDSDIDISNDVYKLNKESKDEIRKEIMDKLQDLTFSENKVKLPKNLLDLILFDYYEDGYGVKYKKIGLLGWGLNRLDLSDVSFEDVSFNNTDRTVTLAYSNAKIDFSKSYEYKNENCIVVRGMLLREVDLSNNDFTELSKEEAAIFSDCDLRDTNIKITKDTKAVFTACNLSGCKTFEYMNFSLSEFPDMRCCNNEDLIISICNLADTKINLIGPRGGSTDNYRKICNSPEYIGCSVNGYWIKHPRQINDNKEKVLEEYKTYSENKKKKVLGLVKAQGNKNKKK